MSFGPSHRRGLKSVPLYWLDRHIEQAKRRAAKEPYFRDRYGSRRFRFWCRLRCGDGIVGGLACVGVYWIGFRDPLIAVITEHAFGMRRVS